MLKVFKNVIQYESSKLINYEFEKIKQVDNKHVKKAKNLILANFSNLSHNDSIIYKYTHSSGKTSIIDMSTKTCSCVYMFEHGICTQLIRIAIIEEFELPGMSAHVRLITKKREKLTSVNNLIVESDDEFTTNINAIETQVANAIALNLPEHSGSGIIPVATTGQPKNKRGRKKKEILPKALEKSPEPDDEPKQAIRRSQRNKK